LSVDIKLGQVKDSRKCFKRGNIDKHMSADLVGSLPLSSFAVQQMAANSYRSTTFAVFDRV
jgi:hypothetical protein